MPAEPPPEARAHAASILAAMTASAETDDAMTASAWIVGVRDMGNGQTTYTGPFGSMPDAFRAGGSIHAALAPLVGPDEPGYAVAAYPLSSPADWDLTPAEATVPDIGAPVDLSGNHRCPVPGCRISAEEHHRLATGWAGQIKEARRRAQEKLPSTEQVAALRDQATQALEGLHDVLHRTTTPPDPGDSL